MDDVSVSDPDRWSTDVVVADGGVLHLRALRPDDGPALLAFIDRLSDESTYYRFMSKWRPRTLDDLARFLDVDHVHRVALVAELADDIVAVGRYMYDEERRSAEVAFTVDDRHQLRGIGTLLLEHLAVIARTNGISRFHAETLGDNQKMLRVFAHAGYRVHRSLEHGVWEIDFSIDDTPAEVLAARETAAEAASVRRILAPGSVAVVGAGTRPGSVGQALVRSIRDGGFTGVVHPVNPHASSVAGVQAYPSLRDIPGPVDLAVIAVPAASVAAVVAEAGEIGVGAAIVISTGFADTGTDGLASQVDLVRLAHRHGLRLVGPSCIGVVNTDPEVSLHATIAPMDPLPGVVGFASQSGALGLAIVATGRRAGLGFASFVSLGNKADVSGNDLLQYWLADTRTAVGMLHLESLGNPRKFSRLARRFCRTKPLIVVKTGRGDGDSADGPDTNRGESFTATLFEQAGVIRVATLQEMLDVGRLLVQQPLPAGRRVAVVADSSGPAVLAADACRAAGLELADLAPPTRRALRRAMGSHDRTDPAVGAGDPAAEADRSSFETALGLVLADPGVDIVLAVHTDPLVTDPSVVTDAIGRVIGAGPSKPVAVCLLAGRYVDGEEIVQIAATGPDGAPRTVPVFAFPEAPATALGLVAGYAEWRRRDPGTVPELDDVHVEAARLCVGQVLAGAPDGRELTDPEFCRLLGTVGLAVAPTVTAGTHAGAAAGGSDDATEPTGGVEVVIGIARDRDVGHAVTFGLRGIAVDLLGDRRLRLVPLTDADAAALLDAPRGSSLLRGHEGAPPADRAALIDVLLRVSRLADAVPELVELSLDPVTAGPTAAVIGGGRARIGPMAPLASGVRRRLDRP